MRLNRNPLKVFQAGALVALGILPASFALGEEPSLVAKGEPPVPANYVSTNHLGWMHGAQYWINLSATPDSIEDDFRIMAEEDHINLVRIAFWMWRDFEQTVPQEAWDNYDACFRAGKKYGIKINPAFYSVNGYSDGGSDDPQIRQAWKEYIQQFVLRYKDEPALAFWTSDVEAFRSHRLVEQHLTPITVERYLEWLKIKYPTVEDYVAAHPLTKGYPGTRPPAGPNETIPGVDNPILEPEYITADWGLWNKFQPRNDWITFNCYMNNDLMKFQADVIRKFDPDTPISITPYDVLLNQPVQLSRNLWWILDLADLPSFQMQSHWHLEIADMPRESLAAQAATIRKIFSASRDRGISITGEYTAGPEYGEGARRYSPTGEEILATNLVHLAEGSKGFMYWLWNPLEDGPNAGLWSLRELDGSPSERSISASRFGEMISKNNQLLFGMKPADTPVAIYDSMDAAIYLDTRDRSGSLARWFVKNQYAFFKALRQSGIGCDFIDIRGLRAGKLADYAVLYFPFSMAITFEEATFLRKYVEEGGTILCDLLTAFSLPNGEPFFQQQPGAGLSELLGLSTNAYEVVNSQLNNTGIYDTRGRLSNLVASEMRQTVKPTTAQILFQDEKGRPLITVNSFGKGHALWTGTLLGLTCAGYETPPERYQAVADLIRPYIPQIPWKVESSGSGLICRRLSDGQKDVFVLLNEGVESVRFTLDIGRAVEPQELLYFDQPSWKKTSDRVIEGKLSPRQGSVIYCPRS